MLAPRSSRPETRNPLLALPSAARLQALPPEARDALRDLDEGQLMAQEIMQQGAVHAVSFLLAHGCTERLAGDMLESLRLAGAAVRAEIERRGGGPLFTSDQTA